MNIFMLPIEPLDMRYSTQWSTWFRHGFTSREDLRLTILNPKPLTTEITNGAFLDVCGTNYYKAKQLAEMCEFIHNGDVKDGDIIFVHDAWFPGIEMLAYIRDGLGIKFKIAGCLHAGTYDPTDFISKKGMGVWGRDLENSWFQIYDAIFVATEYHKNLLQCARYFSKDSIYVTGFPLERPKCTIGIRKDNIVVFPHRLTEDKQPHLFDELARILSISYPDWQFIKTQEVKRSKQEYYNLLQRSKISVSFALHENWGIGMQESVMMNCLPIVPNRLSYKEMYPVIFRYDGLDEAVYKTAKMIEACNADMTTYYADDFYATRSAFIDNGENAIPKIIEVLLGLKDIH